MILALLVFAVLLIILFYGGQGDGRMIFLSCLGGMIALVLWSLFGSRL